VLAQEIVGPGRRAGLHSRSSDRLAEDPWQARPTVAPCPQGLRGEVGSISAETTCYVSPTLFRTSVYVA